MNKPNIDNLIKDIDFREIYENSLNATFLCNKNQEIILANNSFLTLSGFTMEQLTGKDPINILDPVELENNPIRFDLLEKGETICNERSIKIASGEVRTFELKAKKIVDDIIQVVVNDITEKKKLIEKNKNQNALNNALIELLPGFFYVFDEDLSLLKWNNEIEHFFGLSPDDLITKNILDFFPATKEHVKNECLISSLKNKNKALEASITKNNGELVPFLFNSVAMYFGNETLYCGIGQDISLIKEIQKQLTEEKQFSEMLLQSLPGIFYIFDEGEKLVHWNKNAEYITGYSKDELRTKKFSDFIADKTSYLAFHKFKETIKKGNFQGIILTKDKKEIPHLQRGVEFEKNGKKYLMCIGFDISSLIKTQRKYQKSEEKFRNIFNSTSDAIVIFDKDFKVITANKSFIELNVTPNGQPENINIFDYICDENKEQRIKKGTEIISQGLVYEDEFMARDSKNRIFPIEIRGRKINFEEKECMLASLNDISERKQLEKEIYFCSLKAEESERERIAKELHDGLGPIFSTCKIYLHNIRSVSYNDDERNSYDKLCQLINESLVEIRSISNNLCPHVLHNFGLIDALKSLTENLLIDLKLKIDFECNIVQRLDNIVEITMYRIITELVNNCIKHANAQQLKLSLLLENNTLTLFYSDNGKGFNFEETMKKNLGSGLFNIHSRVRSLGGNIRYCSTQKEGTNVKIELKLNK